MVIKTNNSNYHSWYSIFYIPRLVILFFLLFTKVALCTEVRNQAHYNQIMITRENENRLIFEFSINVPIALNKALSPEKKSDVFLSQYTNLSKEKFQNQIQVFIKELQSNCLVYTPQGSKYQLMDWELPKSTALQSLLRDEMQIQKVPPEFQVHSDPIKIRAVLKSKEPVSRIKLQISKALMPILIFNSEQQNLWLTDLSPQIIVNIP